MKGQIRLLWPSIQRNWVGITMAGCEDYRSAVDQPVPPSHVSTGMRRKRPDQRAVTSVPRLSVQAGGILHFSFAVLRER